MSREFAPLPPEAVPPLPEFPPAAQSFSAGLPVLPPPEILPPETALRAPVPKKKIRRLKSLLLASVAAAAVSMVGTSALSEDSVAAVLDDHPLAYCADSAAECEAYIENELWWLYFSEHDPSGHSAPFAGIFPAHPGGPGEEFRAAVTVRPSLHHGGPLGLDYWEYTVRMLPEGQGTDGGTSYTGQVLRLPDARQVILRSVAGGETYYRLIDTAAECSADGELTLSVPYAGALTVFGNGADIVGYFSLEETRAVAHITTEHSHTAGRTNFSFILTVEG